MTEITKTTIRMRRPATAQEDFSPPPEPEKSVRTNLENLTILDFFAAFASSGVARKQDNPVLVAAESYGIGREMMRLHEKYRD